MGPKIKVLFLAADPFRHHAPLKLADEVRAIDHAIQQGSARDTLELVSHFATRTGDLHYALLRHRPDVVHFAGHGDAPGVIYLEDQNGRARPVGNAALGSLFGILKGATRVVVLNGCDTLPMVEAISKVVDFAIGMNRPVSDRSALVFAEAFYRALAFGEDVNTAFELGVNQLQVNRHADVAVPVLRVRDGVDPRTALAARDGAGARGGGAERPAGAVQVNVMERLDAQNEVRFDNRQPRQGSGPAGTQETRIGRLSARDVTFGNG